MKAAKIALYIRERYSLPRYALFFEVPDQIGSNSTRRADAIAVQLDSPLHDLIGFEIKTSRSDWLRELKQPEKSECFAKQCNEFYIVAPHEVIQEGELPNGYGWIIPGVIRVRHKAERRIVSPDVQRSLTYCLLRSAALTCEKYEKIRRIIDSSLYEFITKEKTT